MAVTILNFIRKNIPIPDKRDTAEMGDKDENKEFAALKRSRSSNAAQLTKIYKELERKMMSRENVSVVTELNDKLCDKFESFKTVHLQCLELCTDAENVDNLETNYESSLKNFVEFRERLSQWIADK